MGWEVALFFSACLIPLLLVGSGWFAGMGGWSERIWLFVGDGIWERNREFASKPSLSTPSCPGNAVYCTPIRHIVATQSHHAACPHQAHLHPA